MRQVLGLLSRRQARRDEHQAVQERIRARREQRAAVRGAHPGRPRNAREQRREIRRRIRMHRDRIIVRKARTELGEGQQR